MIDLHMHSNYSDGTNTIVELLQKAEEKQLKAIAITDHETCIGHMEINNIDTSKYFSGRIIPGVEMKAFYKGKIIDILGYNMDIEKMEVWLRNFYQNRSFEHVQTKYLDYYYTVCEKLNIIVTPKEELDWDPKKEWASVLIHKEITENTENKGKIPDEAWENFDVFRFNCCYNPNSIFYIDKSEDFPKMDECIKAIKDAGGIAFLAHAFIYKWAEDKQKFINDVIENYDIDGIECYYSKFTDEQIDYVVNLCNEKNLYLSGGSDYHGDNSIGIEMGIGRGNLYVPDEIIESWL